MCLYIYVYTCVYTKREATSTSCLRWRHDAGIKSGQPLREKWRPSRGRHVDQSMCCVLEWSTAHRLNAFTWVRAWIRLKAAIGSERAWTFSHRGWCHSQLLDWEIRAYCFCLFSKIEQSGTEQHRAIEQVSAALGWGNNAPVTEGQQKFIVSPTCREETWHLRPPKALSTATWRGRLLPCFCLLVAPGIPCFVTRLRLPGSHSSIWPLATSISAS